MNIQEIRWECYPRVAVADSSFTSPKSVPLSSGQKTLHSTFEAKGRITGHHGRSTRLMLLRRNGVGLDDLAEYAGHADDSNIGIYARKDYFNCIA